MSENKKRQPAGIPVGGQFAANEHDEAGGSLAVDHNTLMERGETREMPLGGFEFGEITVTKDESGRQNVSTPAPENEWGVEARYDDDDDRVSFLTHFDGITGSVTSKGELSEDNSGWAPSYGYTVELTNPHTGESMTQDWATGSAHKNTPKVSSVMSDLVSESISVEDMSFQDWCREYGYDSDEEHEPLRKNYDACVKLNREMRNFLGDRFADYAWGNSEASSIDGSFIHKPTSY